MGAPIGNTNGANGHKWREAIKRALDKRSRAAQVEALDELAEKLLSLCDQGDLGALKELGDRLDGKPKQIVDVGNDNGERGLIIRHVYGTGQQHVEPAEVAITAIGMFAPDPDAD